MEEVTAYVEREHGCLVGGGVDQPRRRFLRTASGLREDLRELKGTA